ncbi:MAG: hypothetical protein ABIB61_04395 [Candidatus Shapirobacteria bacterium]
MNQYPIPQEISSYEFRLVGSMTLNQFLKLAAGVVFAYLLFHSGLTSVLRFPLSLAILLLGIGTAFLPFNDRPLEYWLVSFFRAAYSPTVFIWKKPFFPKYSFYKPTPVPVFSQVLSTPVENPAKTPKVPEKRVIPPAPVVQEKEKQETILPPSEKEGSPSSDEIIQMIRKNTPKQKLESSSPEYLKISLPATPTVPNIINGLIMDLEGRTLEGAIVEIQDLEGNPIRAMRSNSLGQFQTATPLPNGQYLVLVEKEPFSFAIIKIETKGKIIPPLQIQAKKTALA